MELIDQGNKIQGFGTIKRLSFCQIKETLKFYEQYTSFHKTLSKGHYDCIRGTTLYVLLLDALDFKYETPETDYHIYLIVWDNEQRNTCWNVQISLMLL